MNLVKVGNLGEFILTANQSSDILILLIICSGLSLVDPRIRSFLRENENPRDPFQLALILDRLRKKNYFHTFFCLIFVRPIIGIRH